MFVKTFLRNTAVLAGLLLLPLSLSLPGDAAAAGKTTSDEEGPDSARVRVYFDEDYAFSAPTISEAVNSAAEEIPENTGQVDLVLEEGIHREEETVRLDRVYGTGFTGTVNLGPAPGDTASIKGSAGPVLQAPEGEAEIIIRNTEIQAAETGNGGILLVDTGDENSVVNLENNRFTQANKEDVAWSGKGVSLQYNTYQVTRCPGFIASGGEGMAGDLPGTGETVLFREGDFEIADPLKGLYFNADRVTVKSEGEAVLYAVEGGVVLGGNDIDFQGINIKGQPDKPHEAELAGLLVKGNRVQVKNVAVAGFQVGIQAGSPDNAQTAENVTVENSTVESCMVGVRIAKGSAGEVTVQNNLILDCTGYGLLVEGQDSGERLRVRSNTIRNCPDQSRDSTRSQASIWLGSGTGNSGNRGDNEDRYYTTQIFENELVQGSSSEKALATEVPYSYEGWLETLNGEEQTGYTDYYQDEKVLLRMIKGRNSYSSEAKSLGEILAGEDRYHTAAQISRHGWGNGSDTVILARGDDFSDALSGTLLADQHQAPILLTRPGKLPAVIKEEIKRLEPEKAHLLGGEAAVSGEVENLLQEEMGVEVNRISGENRYETALEIAREIRKDLSFDKAILVNRSAFADAVSAGPLSAALEAPILPVKEEELPEAIEEAMQSKNGGFEELEKLYLVGGLSVLSSDLQRSLYSDYRLERLAGEDRTGTSVEVARALEEELPGGRLDALYFTCGEDFPDALAGGALASQNEGAVILASPYRMQESDAQFFQQESVEDKELFTLGGHPVVNKDLLHLNLAPYREMEWGHELQIDF